jgi:hypothetical protein
VAQSDGVFVFPYGPGTQFYIQRAFLTQNGLFETVKIICIRSVPEGICHFWGERSVG